MRPLFIVFLTKRISHCGKIDYLMQQSQGLKSEYLYGFSKNYNNETTLGCRHQNCI